MEIIDLKLQFIPCRLSAGNIPKYIGLHHSGGLGTLQDYHKMHQDNGWAGFGYNFFVDLDGAIYKGRPIEYVPSGILNHNQNSLHICANGNFENMVMAEAQCEAIKELILYCVKTYPSITAIYGHKDLMDTDCPGKNYPLQIMKDIFVKGLSEATFNSASSPTLNKVFKLQNILNVMGVTDGANNKLSEDGSIGPLTRQALSKITIKRGATGALVGWIQEQLGVTVDNIYGAYPCHETYDSLINFQKNNNLTVDGIAGVNTLTKLAS